MCNYVLKCYDDYVANVSWDIMGLDAEHCVEQKHALRLSYSEAHDLCELINMHKVFCDDSQYRVVRVRK